MGGVFGVGWVQELFLVDLIYLFICSILRSILSMTSCEVHGDGLSLFFSFLFFSFLILQQHLNKSEEISKATFLFTLSL